MTDQLILATARAVREIAWALNINLMHTTKTYEVLKLLSDAIEKAEKPIDTAPKPAYLSSHPTDVPRIGVVARYKQVVREANGAVVIPLALKTAIMNAVRKAYDDGYEAGGRT